MQETGFFYCTVPRSPSLATWLLSRTKSEKLVHQKLDTVLSSWEDDNPLGSSYESLSRAASLSPEGSIPHTQTFAFPGGGLTVRLGLDEVASELYRVSPYTYCSEDGTAAICFIGYLSNLQELSRRYGRTSPDAMGRRSPKARASFNNRAPPPAQPTLERLHSIERSLDVGALTASVVLDMYLQERDGNELILLSELQGQYAFVIYDSKRKQAFAARDPSGREALYFHTNEDGGVSFANSPMSIPDGERAHEWEQLPPGHFISGRVPKLHQFALTPQQLQVREMREMLEDVDGPSSTSEEESGAILLHRRSSVDANNQRISAAAEKHRPRSLELPDVLFGMDL